LSIQPTDAASHFLATAVYAHCQAFANGIYDPANKDAAAALEKIFDNAAKVAATQSAPQAAGDQTAEIKPPTRIVASPDTAGVAIVSFEASVSDSSGKTFIYTVTSNPADGSDRTKDKTALKHSVDGLVSGKTYSFTVTATNPVTKKTSAVSDASNAIKIK